ncbi:hypothetical protein LTR53_005472 [Teratosphaeriaceae sp. CCFEE 6253]|nr:hypothetical protein LTR53_005472 [Teratosphaeriaceae sp. CCFEE 6253]
MGSPLPPDPYLALGVAKDATAAAIKLQYRKLVLKFHPDKVQDESQKEAAADQFHKIQTAWEIVGDEDKRKRYDAHCELAQLRRDVLSDRGAPPPRAGSEIRTAAFKQPPETPRGGAYHARGPERRGATSPTYEERKPSDTGAYSTTGDYFDYTPRGSARRKSEDYERSTKRTPLARDDRDRMKAAKEAKEVKERERMRQSRERNRRSDRDIQRDRDRKAASVVEEEEESGSDMETHEKQSRHPREEPDELKRAQDAYHEQARKDKEAAQRGYYDNDERAKKMYSQYDGAREYVEKSRGARARVEADRRPYPVRMSSSRDKVEYIKRGSGAPPVMVRRGSGRPTMLGRDAEERRPAMRENDRRRSDDDEELPHRPPTLSKSKSSPAEIKLPTMEKQRSHSMQVDSPVEKEDLPPKVKRADSMPHVTTTRDREVPRRKDGMPNMPSKGSSLRQTEFAEGMPTPGATPEYSGNTDKASKYRAYADDHEYPTPDGYRTEVRHPSPSATAAPVRPRYTKSPDRMGERERDRPHRDRTASTRYEEHLSPHRPAQPSRTTSTSYVYSPGQGVSEAYARPGMSRENSAARTPSGLYGEIPTTATAAPAAAARDRERDLRSPRQSSARYAAPPEDVRYAKDVRPEDIRMQSGYGTSGRRTTDARPTYSRGGSYVYAK